MFTCFLRLCWKFPTGKSRQFFSRQPNPPTVNSPKFFPRQLVSPTYVSPDSYFPDIIYGGFIYLRSLVFVSFFRVLPIYFSHSRMFPHPFSSSPAIIHINGNCYIVKTVTGLLKCGKRNIRISLSQHRYSRSRITRGCKFCLAIGMKECTMSARWLLVTAKFKKWRKLLERNW